MIRAAAWSGEAIQHATRYGQPRVSASDEAALDYGSQLNRIESTLNSILAASRSATDGAGRTTRPRLANSSPQPPGFQSAELAYQQEPVEEREERGYPTRYPGPHSRRPYAFGEEGSSAGQGRVLPLVNSEVDTTAYRERRLDRTAARHAEPWSIPPSDILHAEIAKVSDAIQGLDSPASHIALEQAIGGLTRTIDALRSEGTKGPVLQSLAQLVNELRQTIAVIDPRKRNRPSERAEDSGDFPTSDKQQEQLAERGDRKVPRFAESVEQRRRAEREDSIERAALQDGARALNKIEERLNAVDAKIEEVITEARDQTRYDALSQRIENVRQELTVRIAEAWLAPDTKPLEELLHGLSKKLDVAQESHAEKRAVEALERQLAELVAQFDSSSAQLSSLATIEATIGDLFSEIERTRAVAFEAAENAARKVLNESDRDSEIGEEIQRWRTIQDEADRRTLSTLTTVHDILNKLFERLANVEEAISQRPKQGESAEIVAQRDLNTTQRRGSARDGMARGANAETKPRDPEDIFVELRGYLEGAASQLSGAQQRVSGDQEQAPSKKHSDLTLAAHRAADRARTTLGQNQTGTARLKADSDNTPRQKRDFFAEYRRPLALLLIATCVALGAYGIFETIAQRQSTHLSLNAANPIATDSGRAAPQAYASAPQVPSAAPQEAAALPPDVSSPPAFASSEQASVPAPAPEQASAPAPTSTASAGSTSSPADDSVAPMSNAGPSPVDIEVRPKIATHEIMPADLQMAAEGGNAKAQFALATDYAEGRHVRRDPAAAARWYQKAAVQGLAQAQFRLGLLYQQGLGVQRDLEKATAWYLKAAEKGNITAMHNLAVLSASKSPDYASAARWFQRAAEYGLLNSQYDLAVLLARGLGVQQNAVSAYTWFAIAAAQGDADAAKKRDEIGATLDADQLAAAKSVAASFRAKTPDAAANDESLTGWTGSSSGKGQRQKVSEL
jgi:localization factor PodJL